MPLTTTDQWLDEAEAEARTAVVLAVLLCGLQGPATPNPPTP